MRRLKRLVPPKVKGRRTGAAVLALTTKFGITNKNARLIAKHIPVFDIEMQALKTLVKLVAVKPRGIQRGNQ